MTDLSRFRSGGLFIGIPLMILMFGAVAFTGLTASSEPASDRGWLPVVAAPLEHRIGLIGRIVPASSTTLTAPFEGTVEEKLFSDDQRVARGQLLLRLNTDLLRMQIRDALAERLKVESAVHALESWADGEEMARARRALSSSQLRMADTHRKLTETQGLLEQGIVPRMEVDSLEQQLNTQRLDVKAAQAELLQTSKRGQGEHRQIADMQLANARARHKSLLALAQRGEIRAPFAGIIVRLPDGPSGSADKPVEPGVLLNQGQALFGIASVERLSMIAKVDEMDINQLREGMAVDITGDGFEGTLQGTISSVGAHAITADMHGEGASYHVTVAMAAHDPSSASGLRLGMSARLSILSYQNPDAVVLPADAIGEEGGKHYVFHRPALDQPGVRRSITLGKTTAQGVEVFGLETGFVKREVSMD